MNPPPTPSSNNPQKSRSGLTRLVYALGFSWKGLKAAYANEKAFRLETHLALLMLPASFWLGQTWVEIALLAGSVLGVMAAELVNSAIEAVVDRISTERHELSGRAKDLGSACVLLMVGVALLVWGGAICARLFPHT